VHSLAVRGLELAVRDRAQPATENLDHVGGGVQRDRDHRAGESGQTNPDLRQAEIEYVQQGQKRNIPHNLDVADQQVPHERIGLRPQYRADESKSDAEQDDDRAKPERNGDRFRQFAEVGLDGVEVELAHGAHGVS
jgi:hypothetical protein